MAEENEVKKEIYRRPSWDEYFMKIVEMVGTRGNCDRFRGGCVITRDRRIVVTGYNGAPAGAQTCDEAGHEMHTVVNEDGTQSRHCIRTTHAEQNAICEAARMGISLDGGTLYCQMTPCYTCAKMLINSGIKRVVCAKDYHAGQRTKEIFKETGVEYSLSNEEVTKYEDQ
jgi:dCMP deaminase